MQMELRFADVKLNSSDDGSLKVSGYVNQTNRWSHQLGTRKKFVERIMPGAFAKALQRAQEVNFLAEHDNGKILASTRNNSLNLREDDQGLYMEAQISPTSWGKDYHTLINDGIIQNMSFGFSIPKTEKAESWRQLPDHTYERTIHDLDLYEVSAVRYPAYPQSTIAARGIDLVEDVEIPDDVEVAEAEKREDNVEMANDKQEKRDFDPAQMMDVLQQILAGIQALQPQPADESADEQDAEVDAEDVQTDEVVAESNEALTEAVEELTEAIGELTEEVEELTGVIDPEFEAQDEAEDAAESQTDADDTAPAPNANDYLSVLQKLLDL